MKFRLLISLVRPFASIARELRILRELYEMDLASRDRPIVRVTERASKKDTEVSYAGVVDERPTHRRWFSADEDDGEVDDV